MDFSSLTMRSTLSMNLLYLRFTELIGFVASYIFKHIRKKHSHTFLSVFFSLPHFLFPILVEFQLHVYLTVWYCFIGQLMPCLVYFLSFFLYFILDKISWSIFKVTNLIILLTVLCNPSIFSYIVAFQIYNFFVSLKYFPLFWRNYPSVHLFFPSFST